MRSITERVRKDQTDFRGLSYNKLRKTAANLVREQADGEVAAVFLCHGTPVRADALLDVYTNPRPARIDGQTAGSCAMVCVVVHHVFVGVHRFARALLAW
jgi:hypothetical protein